MKSTAFGFTVLFAIVMLGSACSTDDEASSLVGTLVTEVQITSSGFSPAQVRIKVDDVVSWSWSDGLHNVVSGTNCTADGTFTSGPEQTSGTFERKFETVGTFPYFSAPDCLGGATGEVIVEP